LKEESALAKRIGLIRGKGDGEEIPLLTFDDIRASTDLNELAESMAFEPSSSLSTTLPELKWLVKHRLNFSTLENGAVFWSGQNRPFAEKWAESTGRKTMEMTEGGRYLDGLDLFNGKGTYDKDPLPKGQPCQIWDLASTQFASSARGKAFSFSLDTPAENPVYCTVRTWFR
jgi:hypothetical protein